MIAVCGDFIQNACRGCVDHERERVSKTLLNHCVFSHWNIQLIALTCGICIDFRIIDKKRLLK